MANQNTPRRREPDNGEGCKIILTPQCVGCTHNMGGFDCAAINTKPDIFISNMEQCPLREEAL